MGKIPMLVSIFEKSGTTNKEEKNQYRSIL